MGKYFLCCNAHRPTVCAAYVAIDNKYGKKFVFYMILVLCAQRGVIHANKGSWIYSVHVKLDRIPCSHESKDAERFRSSR